MIWSEIYYTDNIIKITAIHQRKRQQCWMIKIHLSLDLHFSSGYHEVSIQYSSTFYIVEILNNLGEHIHLINWCNHVYPL